jgi:O-antigen/teichoic acid export membrane protein
MTRLHDKPSRVLSGPKIFAWINGVYAIAEYLSQPLGLLLAAPYLLRHLGPSQFGIWVLAGAAVNGGNLLSSSFGDAAVKYGAMYRGRGDSNGVARVVRGMITINLALSGLFAVVLWAIAPYAANHISHIETGLQHPCTLAFRIGSLLLVVRSIDSVFACTLRAFERYGPPVRIAICSRASALIVAIGLVMRGFGVVEIMLATLCIAVLAAIAQGIAVRAIAGKVLLLPSLHRETLSMIAGFGCFSWMQALSAVVFSQADRLVIGVLLGAPAVACYALCAQAAQTIHGIASAGLHILFPHLSSRLETETLADLRHTVRIAFKTNLLLAGLLGAPIVLFSRPLLSLWMGPEFARQGWLALSILGTGFALFAMNVTAHYALLAVGKVRLVTAFNLAAGAAMLLLMLLLTPKFGLVGTACARLVTGPLTCILYYPLYKVMHGHTQEHSDTPSLVAWENSV